MRCLILIAALLCCVLATGCNSAAVQELTLQVEQLEKENAVLTEELQTIRKDREELRKQVAQIDEIRQGYEEARREFQKQLAGFTAVLGANAANPLPPFEELKNSEWVGKLMPGAAAELGDLKSLQEAGGDLLRGILGDQEPVNKRESAK